MLQRGLNQGGRVLQGDFDEIRWVGTGDVSHLSIERGLHECRIDRLSGARVLKREMTARPASRTRRARPSQHGTTTHSL